MNKKFSINNNSNDNSDKMFKFVTTISVIIVLLLALYLVVGIFFTKEIKLNDEKKKEEKQSVTIDNKTITAGQIFEQKDNSYYVLVYDVDSKLTNLSTFASIYSSKENSIPIYTVDSSNKMNSRFISEESNKTPTSYDDLKIKVPTLIKIENKVVTEYIENESDIKNVLK